MKHKKKVEKLKKRIKDYEQTLIRLSDKARRGYRKPGSVQK